MCRGWHIHSNNGFNKPRLRNIKIHGKSLWQGHVGKKGFRTIYCRVGIAKIILHKKGSLRNQHQISYQVHQLYKSKDIPLWVLHICSNSSEEDQQGNSDIKWEITLYMVGIKDMSILLQVKVQVTTLKNIGNTCHTPKVEEFITTKYTSTERSLIDFPLHQLLDTNLWIM